MDAADPLRACHERFVLPEGLIYLDGNSLGALPKAAIGRKREVIEREWGASLIRSWNDHGWIDAPQRVGARIAPLIGARSEEHTSELQSLMRISYAVFCLKKNTSTQIMILH